MIKKILLIFVVLAFSGCVAWTKLSGRVYQEKGFGFRAEMAADWMRYSLVPYFLMTKDGIVLDSIFVERVRFNKKLDHTKKTYFEEMTAEELAEIEIDNIKSDDSIDIDLISNRLERVDNRLAFRAEYIETINETGLKVHAIQYGFVEGKWIYRIIYKAVEQHYFPLTKGAFERFIETFQLI